MPWVCFKLLYPSDSHDPSNTVNYDTEWLFNTVPLKLYCLAKRCKYIAIFESKLLEGFAAYSIRI
jgi:hypothetical protein